MAGAAELNYRTLPGNRREHRVLAEHVLGKKLSRRVIVHHVDGCKGRNKNKNLVICENQAYHILLHMRQRSLEATGDPHNLFCSDCKQWLSHDAFGDLPKNKGMKQKRNQCRECSRIRSREYYAKNRERMKVYFKRYYAENAETVKAQQKRYRQRRGSRKAVHIAIKTLDSHERYSGLKGLLLDVTEG